MFPSIFLRSPFCGRFLRRYADLPATFITSPARCFLMRCRRTVTGWSTGPTRRRPLIFPHDRWLWLLQNGHGSFSSSSPPSSQHECWAVTRFWYLQNRWAMNLTYVLDYRFARTPDGVIWTDTAYDQTFWEPYLRVFDQVTILSRVREVSKADSAWLPVNSERVRVEALPHYLGPREFLKRSAQIQACVRKALQLPCAVILRVPSQLAVVAASQLRRLHKPYGVEVVGDASAAFAPGVVKVKGRAFLRQWFTHSQTKICHNAVAVSYVAECLRRRYPSNKKATTLV